MNITLLLRKSVVIETLAQMLSGAVVYYVGLALYHFFSNGRYASVPALGLMIFTALAFPLLVIGWNRITNNYRMVISLPLGIILLLPGYFSAWAYFEGSTVSLSEILRATIGGYSIFPLHLLSIQMTPWGWSLDIAVVVTLLSGSLLDTIRILKKA